MDKRNNMIAGAARAFEAEGFRGIGVDGILAPSGASTRTLYKHFGSRDGLVLAVLEERHRDFMGRLELQSGNADPVGGLFDTLEQWLIEHGARGCMLLRARSEYASANEDVVALVRRQKEEFERERSLSASRRRWASPMPVLRRRSGFSSRERPRPRAFPTSPSSVWPNMRHAFW